MDEYSGEPVRTLVELTYRVAELERRGGWLMSGSFFKRALAVFGYWLLTWVALSFIIGFILGLLGGAAGIGPVY